MIDARTEVIVTGARGQDEDNEHAVSFQFSATWSSLFALLEPAKPPVALVPVAPLVPAENRAVATVPAPAEPSTPAASAPLDRSSPTERPKAAAGSEVNWEMVIPKMARPANRAASVKEAAPARPLPPAQSPAIPERTAAPTATIPSERGKAASKPAYVVTQYKIAGAETELLSTAAGSTGPSSFAVNLILGLVAILALAVVVWIGSLPAASKSVQVESALGQRGWVRQRMPLDAGGREERRLILYRPSLASTDAELEFNWNIAGNGIGWVFRARDSSNYYAMRLKAVGSGPSMTLAEERFTVTDGKESPHYEKALALAPVQPPLSIRMSVAGSDFRLYLQGEPQDTWTDPTLKAGGFGFLEENNQPVDVQSVRLAYSKIPESNFTAMLQSLKQSFK